MKTLSKLTESYLVLPSGERREKSSWGHSMLRFQKHSHPFHLRVGRETHPPPPGAQPLGTDICWSKAVPGRQSGYLPAPLLLMHPLGNSNSQNNRAVPEALGAMMMSCVLGGDASTSACSAWVWGTSRFRQGVDIVRLFKQDCFYNIDLNNKT